MFFLSKILPYLLYPLTWVLVLLALGFSMVLKGKKVWALSCTGSAFFILWIASSPLVGNYLLSNLERKFEFESVESIEEADAIVLLTGAVGLPLKPRLYPDLNRAADRLIHAARIYKAGKAPVIYVSGGQVWKQPGLLSEADYNMEYLQMLGVPEKSIIKETRSRNTAENAYYTKQLLRRDGIHRIILVTSAAHMPRSMLLFNAPDLQVKAAPADINAVEVLHPKVFDWIPSAKALTTTTAAIREYIGYWYYRLNTDV